MADSFQDEPSINIDQVFRPAKRRKFYRKRPNDDDDSNSNNSDSLLRQPESTTPLTIDELILNHGVVPAETKAEAEAEAHGDNVSSSVTELLRVRKAAAQRKRGGVEFSNFHSANNNDVLKSSRTDNLPSENDDTIASIEKKVVNRFAPQTGLVADVDKHMMAYVDSELAKRRQGQDLSTFSDGNSRWGGSQRGSANDTVLNRQPAALGKLLEIDLGPDATLRNIAMTEAARRRLEGGAEETDEGTGKVRLRKDGRPFRRPRRRNSEDVKRDRLVEEVMKESKLEIYDEPEEDAGNDDQAADDRIAEQFRREFMEAISSRRQRAGPTAASKAAKGAKVEDKPKGPKLGGSRSARAAMRELQEKATKK